MISVRRDDFSSGSDDDLGDGEYRSDDSDDDDDDDDDDDNDDGSEQTQSVRTL